MKLEADLAYVLGAGEAALRPSLDGLPVPISVNELSEQGMGTLPDGVAGVILTLG